MYFKAVKQYNRLKSLSKLGIIEEEDIISKLFEDSELLEALHSDAMFNRQFIEFLKINPPKPLFLTESTVYSYKNNRKLLTINEDLTNISYDYTNAMSFCECAEITINSFSDLANYNLSNVAISELDVEAENCDKDFVFNLSDYKIQPVWYSGSLKLRSKQIRLHNVILDNLNCAKLTSDLVPIFWLNGVAGYNVIDSLKISCNRYKNNGYVARPVFIGSLITADAWIYKRFKDYRIESLQNGSTYMSRILDFSLDELITSILDGFEGASVYPLSNISHLKRLSISGIDLHPKLLCRYKRWFGGTCLSEVDITDTSTPDLWLSLFEDVPSCKVVGDV